MPTFQFGDEEPIEVESVEITVKEPPRQLDPDDIDKTIQSYGDSIKVTMVHRPTGISAVDIDAKRIDAEKACASSLYHRVCYEWVVGKRKN